MSGSALQATKEASRQARDGTAFEAARQPAALGAIRELDWEVTDKSGMHLVMKKPCGVKRFRC